MDVEAASLSAGEIGAIARRIDRPLVLVGMMGSGKSTVGRKLASVLGFAFVDADDAIEEAAAMPIADIFSRYGEAYFRDGERRVLARVIEEAGPRQVIATGGGAFADPRTRALILERAIAIWLDCDVDTLVERTARKDTRPLLRQGDPHAILTRLLAERGPAYAEAQLRVESRGGPQQRTLVAILRALAAWL
ncbi:MAG: shikimate kinase [Novosphingobium sp.]